MRVKGEDMRYEKNCQVAGLSIQSVLGGLTVVS